MKTEVQADVDALKTALQAEDDDAVQKAFDKLNESQTKLGEAIYASTQTAQNAEAPAEAEEPAAERERRGHRRRRDRRRRGRARGAERRAEGAEEVAMAASLRKTRRPKDGDAGDEPVVNDKRKIDPETGEAREQATADARPTARSRPTAATSN